MKSMSMYPTKAPHQGARDPLNVAPNAALLIDFDNVTMGMRSDLSKELKSLLNSDIIKGKVTVQRAYADWRRYPQYIVPLSEASIDLIFAPAYGSNKKNATDIRMAIDGIELVFIRPEIGTFILLTGDSDFSSLVLKLKEYGKYVVGVGIQESSSDILVQNCDEYYSYTSLSGLRKTTDSDRQAIDPWVLVERAVEKMGNNDDVMRSDRLKQVMVELDPGFDEGEYGFSKFSRFLTEAAGKGLLSIRKLDNGQYEVAAGGKMGGGRRAEEPAREERPKAEERAPARAEEERRPRPRDEERPSGRSREPRERAPERDGPIVQGEPLNAAYDLLRRALARMAADGKSAVRDSDVKRKMLELEAAFDETNLGFSKFSRFLRQAHDHEVVDLHKQDTGNFEVSLRAGGGGGAPAAPAAERAPFVPPAAPAASTTPAAPEPPVSTLVALGRRFGLLMGSSPKRPAEGGTTALEPMQPVAPAEPPRDSSRRGAADAQPARRESSRDRSGRSSPEDRTPETRADRAEREQQRRFAEAEREREGGTATVAEPTAGAETPAAAPTRERGERGSRGGQGRNRRGGRGGRDGAAREGGAREGEGRERSGRSRGGRSRRGGSAKGSSEPTVSSGEHGDEPMHDGAHAADSPAASGTSFEAVSEHWDEPVRESARQPERESEREAVRDPVHERAEPVAREERAYEAPVAREERSFEAPAVREARAVEAPAMREERQAEPVAHKERGTEPPAREERAPVTWSQPAPTPSAPAAQSEPAAAKPPSEFEGLEPSRLHTRTSRGRR
ncbi:MAG: NYN domain-containing protein, partial [Gemmatimonadetes bacterium]|nr:NYN domain-containing protein [Gemmatimonadota bacterium]